MIAHIYHLKFDWQYIAIITKFITIKLLYQLAAISYDQIYDFAHKDSLEFNIHCI